ncbi:hypothetical protein HG536_0C01140 [Torulaspora globosa]|uniref:Amino acid permease/ SLC12A domain-containing protein n=1 Tax=Torulaspora globosa TaxID=48254 RepID=A0A7G3ZEL1_9SACH|nr:uncharacterized protein HG536_0C01140 [Torulaspora globosa]QLL31947.1 hypothetical protein HG536_0C01140 [Torulaspora globosa]
MGSESPAQGLFPDAHNLQITTAQHGDSIEISEASSDSEIRSTSKNTIDTNILRSIIDDERIHDLEDYKERAANSRFYLTSLYAEKGNITLDKMLVDKFTPESYSDDPSDFKRYNLRVEREYELRDKIQSILQEQACGDVKVLKEELVLESYVADGAVRRHSDRASHKRLMNTVSWVKQRLSGFVANSTAVEPEDILSRNSSCTHIIDNASYRNMAINENTTVTHKREMTRSSESFESNKFSETHSSSRGLVGYLDDFLNGSNHTVYHVQRKLRVRHIQMVGIGACISVGIFLTSGKAFSIAGPFGTLLGFTLTGSVVLATLLSFTELSTLIPVSSGFSGLASRFVEDAFGFALGWTYWFSSMIALPAQIVACTFYLGYFQSLHISQGTTAGFVTLFLIYPILINMMDVRILGEVVYIAGLLKILISVAVVIAMVVLNAGHGAGNHKQVGFRYWDSSKSYGNFTYGLFRPTFDLGDAGEGSMQGIKGAKGRFLAVASVMLISTFAYSGVEMTFVASGEVINPRKSIPSAIKRTFSVVLILYMLLVLTVGINIYSGDPRLLSYYTGSTGDRFIASLNGNVTEWQVTAKCQEKVLEGSGVSKDGVSPWVLALQNFGMCTFASVFNGIMIFFTTGAEVSSLLSSSRTLYAMAVQRKAPAIFQRCNKAGVPYVSVLFSSAFGVVSYLAVDPAAVENFNVLANIASASTSIIWLGLNLSFLRFYYALKARDDIISRDDPSYPYRSPLQPYLSFYGLLGCSIFVLFMGYINFMRNYWNTKSFFSAYGGLMLFAACYIGYKTIGTSKIQRLDQIDMDTGRRETDRMIWTEYKQYSGPYRERAKRLFTWLY